jgi:MFS family permease
VPVLVASLALFVLSLGFGVIVPLLPELTRAGASGASVLSIVYAVYAALKIGSMVPAGAWVDRVGPRRVLNVGLSLYTLSLAGFLVPAGIPYFTAVRGLEGLGTGLAFPAIFAWGLRGTTETTTGKRIGVVTILGTSGLLLGPALGGWLAPHGARVPVMVALVLALIVMAVVFAQRPPASAAVSTPRSVGSELGKMARLGTSGVFLALVLPIAFNKLTFSSFQGLLPLYGPAVLGMDIHGVTLLFALSGVIFGAATAIGGFLVDRWPPRTVVLMASPFLLLSLLTMASTTHALGFTLAYCGYVASSSINYTATMKYAARSFGTDDTYGGVFGMLQTLTDLMTIVGPLLFMNLYAWNARWVFLAMALVGVPFLAGFWLRARVTGSMAGLLADEASLLARPGSA